jgi:hypothetical protein
MVTQSNNLPIMPSISVAWLAICCSIKPDGSTPDFETMAWVQSIGVACRYSGSGVSTDLGCNVGPQRSDFSLDILHIFSGVLILASNRPVRFWIFHWHCPSYRACSLDYVPRATWAAQLACRSHLCDGLGRSGELGFLHGLKVTLQRAELPLPWHCGVSVC